MAFTRHWHGPMPRMRGQAQTPRVARWRVQQQCTERALCVPRRLEQRPQQQCWGAVGGVHTSLCPAGNVVRLIQNLWFWNCFANEAFEEKWRGLFLASSFSVRRGHIPTAAPPGARRLRRGTFYSALTRRVSTPNTRGTPSRTRTKQA